MTRVFRTAAGLSCWRQSLDSIGFVPTMGALHRGHRSLIERALAENRTVIVSIFVNPLQFAPGEDFDRYPRTWEADLALCEELGVSAVFAPDRSEVLPSFKIVPPPEMVRGLCAPFRPGHFEGVCTIVMQLLQIVRPDRVYLGQKDGQQIAILEKLIEDFHLPVELVRCPTLREESGLAYSSRNRYLNSIEYQIAGAIYQALTLAKTEFQKGERCGTKLVGVVKKFLQTIPQIRIQYIECVHFQTLTPLEIIMDGTVAMVAIASYVGNTRLVDNLILQNRRPILAIDGPAGAGKSTVAKRVATKLGLLYLDTGAMYRGITWAVLEAQIGLDDWGAIVELASSLRVSLTPDARLFVNDRNVTDLIRQHHITESVSKVAAIPQVREIMLREQRSLGKSGGVVMEGRDIGTRVFPDAEVKIFLTASTLERAKRRQQDLKERQLEVPPLELIQKSIQERDYRDMNRPVAPLKQAEDAILLNTDGLTIEEVVDRIVAYCNARFS